MSQQEIHYNAACSNDWTLKPLCDYPFDLNVKNNFMEDCTIVSRMSAFRKVLIDQDISKNNEVLNYMSDEEHKEIVGNTKYHPHFASNYYNRKLHFIYPFLKRLYYKSMFLAGGSITTFSYQELEGLEKKYIDYSNNSDLDFFYYNCSTEDVEDSIRTNLQVISNYFKQYSFNYYRSLHAITFVFNDFAHTTNRKLSIQFIYKFMSNKSIDEVLSMFDLGSSMVAYNGETILTNAMGFYALNYYTNIIDENKKELDNSRIKKYFDRGFSLHFSEPVEKRYYLCNTKYGSFVKTVGGISFAPNINVKKNAFYNKDIGNNVSLETYLATNQQYSIDDAMNALLYGKVQINNAKNIINISDDEIEKKVLEFAKNHTNEETERYKKIMTLYQLGTCCPQNPSLTLSL